MEILICKRDEELRTFVTDWLKKRILIDELDMSIELSTDNPDDLIRHMNEKPGFERLYVLSTCFATSSSGIELAKVIRNRDTKGTIIFITNRPEYMGLVFENNLEVMDYIVESSREMMKAKIAKALFVIQERLLLDKERFSFKLGNQRMTEKHQDIMFFVGTGQMDGKVRLHATGRQVLFYGTLQEIEQANPKFFRCHRSCVVNVANIVKVDGKAMEIEMANGEICFVSRRQLKALKEKIRKYA